MPRPVGPRYPFAPLEEYLRRQGTDPARRAVGLGTKNQKFPDQMQAVLGVNTAQIMGYRKRGLGFWLADELAIKAGVLPDEIWPEWADYVPPTDEEKHQLRLADDRETLMRLDMAEQNRKAV